MPSSAGEHSPQTFTLVGGEGRGGGLQTSWKTEDRMGTKTLETGWGQKLPPLYTPTPTKYNTTQHNTHTISIMDGRDHFWSAGPKESLECFLHCHLVESTSELSPTDPVRCLLFQGDGLDSTHCHAMGLQLRGPCRKPAKWLEQKSRKTPGAG